MKKILSLLIVCVFIGCSIKDGEVVKYYETGEKWKQYTLIDGKKNGASTIWHKNGNIEIVSNYINDTLNGSFNSWDENGQMIAEMNYTNGKRDGLQKFWHEGGVWGEMMEKDGVIQSDDMYYPNGQMMWYFNYKNGKRHEFSLGWDEEKQLNAILEYRHGEKVSELRSESEILTWKYDNFEEYEHMWIYSDWPKDDVKWRLVRKCLTIDEKEWCFPSCDEAAMVGLRFRNDGTFTQQSILFGAKRSEGTWKYHSEEDYYKIGRDGQKEYHSGEDKILLKYLWSSDYVIPKNQLAKLTSCQNLWVGNTRYVSN